jgi:hypothetical protein
MFVPHVKLQIISVGHHHHDHHHDHHGHPIVGDKMGILPSI